MADIAAKPLFWQTAPVTGHAATIDEGSAASLSPSEGSGRGALEALWGLHETWKRLEEGGRKLVDGVTVGSDEREARSVALGVVGRIREGDAR